MNFLILAFLISFLATLLLLRYKHLHEKITNDYELSGPQKFHTQAVPRIGGVSIFLSIAITSAGAALFLILSEVFSYYS